ncbi:hypothetical protein EVAR_88847_1 [Eumeta japonica]|uniref:Uncharacterized protein n=1 Tax=Eumeta variegata TaxID=151549 RepID=A0A4C1Y771_EUMVA|nr:hypothetical protein EVAR_88847_1 [Eumeta japonica]
MERSKCPLNLRKIRFIKGRRKPQPEWRRRRSGKATSSHPAGGGAGRVSALPGRAAPAPAARVQINALHWRVAGGRRPPSQRDLCLV